MTVQEDKKTRNSVIREIEFHLKQYRQYKVGMNNLSNQIEFIQPRTTTNYEIREGSMNYASKWSSTEECAIERLESKKALQLQREIQKYQVIVDSIDQSLEELDELEKRFVQYRYFQRWSIRKISLELGYSESSIHVLRRQLMAKLEISLKGILSII
ncbi:sigma-70 family RNA polymerase sigma factor [Bacillus horti]|uniref:DNA-directed RNA polymerase specialized sigma subunit n=1 Tax=Caldalkalibacillus horti TaxID=77523 RepID=A0ABT9W5D8_9BACI|nr:sigma-70 family RNA polymerase sigma factor [Bacillus horti]MDQ0168451.1 DNA-directed RNA polymerase specialized sigma subunit [Bacillus horti]